MFGSLKIKKQVSDGTEFSPLLSKNNYDNVFSSVYAGNIDYYAALLKSDHVVLDVHEFYQKQSFRNRCVIAGANGPLNLIVPIQRIGGKSMMKDLKIDHSQNWKKIHWKSLERAYRTSPYFEYYAHQFKPVLKILNNPSNSILIADEVGLGKTIEAGLIWTELKARYSSKNLIVLGGLTKEKMNMLTDLEKPSKIFE